MNQNQYWLIFFALMFFFMGFMVGASIDFINENQFDCDPVNISKEIEPNVYQITIKCEETG